MTDLSTPPRTTEASSPVLAIEASGVSKKFALGSRSTSLKDRLTGFGEKDKTDFWAVRDVSVSVPRGSMLGIIGRIGSGKSTFLRTLCGIYRPTTGEVRVRGRITALLELGAGFHNELTGRENVYMNGAVVGLSREYMDSVMAEIVAMADIGTFIDSPVETYSSGMRARLGFAVSVQLRPEILLADEITAVGDIAFKEHGARRMQALRERGATVVQVSHNLSMLQDMCDEILWLHHGETMALGDPVDVIAEYVAHAASQEAEAKSARTPEHAARNPGWITRVDVAPGAGLVQPATGSSLRLVIGIEPPEPLADPSIRLRITRPNDVDVGLGSEFGLGERVVGAKTVSCLLPALPLLNGRYRLVVELRSGGGLVANRRIPLDVAPPNLEDGAAFLPFAAEWDVR